MGDNTRTQTQYPYAANKSMMMPANQQQDKNNFIKSISVISPPDYDEIKSNIMNKINGTSLKYLFENTKPPSG